MSSNMEMVDDDREVEVTRPGQDMAVMGAIARAELDQQITTAHAFPRSIKRFVNECRDMALLNEKVAVEMFYVIPRGGKKIEGPSVRMAEIVQSAWGNCQSGARVVEEGKTFVTAQGVFFDLERNVRVTMEVRRRITDKDGRRFNDDMIGVTSSAACSIALRNAIFRGIPKGFWNEIYEEARKVARGNLKSLVTNRTDALDWLAKRGIPNATVIAALGVGGIEDIGLDELESLRGMVTAIKEGETIETVFAPKDIKAPTAKKPATEEPKSKPAATKKRETKPAADATPDVKPATDAPKTETKEPVISVDQQTYLSDMLAEEGIERSLLLAKFEIGELAQLPAAKFKEAVEHIEYLSING